MKKNDLFQKKDEETGLLVYYSDDICTKKYTGHVQSFDYRNDLEYECDIIEGMENGICKEYYQKRLWCIREMKNNKKDGLHVRYHDNGNVAFLELAYKGECLISFKYYLTGEIEHIRECPGTIEKYRNFKEFKDFYHRYEQILLKKDEYAKGSPKNFPKGFEFISNIE